MRRILAALALASIVTARAAAQGLPQGVTFSPLQAPVVVNSTDPLNAQYVPSLAGSNSSGGTVWVTNSLVKVRQDSGSSTGLLVATGTAFRNQWWSFQAHVQAPAGGITSLSVSFASMTNVQTGDVIQSSNIVVYSERYLNCSTITGTANTIYGVPGFYPDILVPKVDPYWNQTIGSFTVTVAGGQNQTFWFDVHPPSAAASGYYVGYVYVSSNGVNIATLVAGLAVWDAVMPSTKTLHTYAGIDYDALGKQSYPNSDSGEGGSATYPGSGGLGDTGIARQQADLATLCMDHGWSCGGNVYPAFSPPSTSTFRAVYEPPLTGAAGGNTYPILTDARLNTIEPIAIHALISSNTAQSWVNESTSRNWSTALIYYNVDEPSSGVDWALFVQVSTAPHQAVPPIPIICTASIANLNSHAATNACDYVIPNIVVLEPVSGSGITTGTYTTFLASSATANGPVRQLWSYQSCSSVGTCSYPTVVYGPSNYTYPNLVVDGLPVANRAFETLTYFHGQVAELYYDFTFCFTGTCGTSGTDPWTSVYYTGGNGDGTLVYPGSNKKIGVTTPIWLPSIRLKHMRDGVQDFEMYTMAANLGLGATVTAQIKTWVTNSYTFSTTPSTFLAAYLTIGNAVHAKKYAGSAGSPW